MYISKLSISLLIILFTGMFSVGFADGTVVPVKIEKICPMDINNIIEVPAEIESYSRVNIAAKLMAYVNSVLGEEGAEIKKGDIVIKLDDRDIVANLNIAEETLKEAEAAKSAALAQVEFAKKQMNRMSELVSKAATNKAAYDQAEAGYHAAAGGLNQTNAKIGQAKAAINNAKIMLSYTELVSPFDGIIIRKNVSVGDLTAPGQPLLTIDHLNKLYIIATVNEKDISSIKIGGSATVFVEALNKEFQGNIFTVIPTGDPVTRTFKVKVVLDNKDLEIKPGMYAKLFITRFSRKGILAVPKRSIITEENKNFVFMVKGNKVEKIEVELGLVGKDYIEVKNGLPSCEHVIVTGKEFLSSGDTISIY